MGINIKSRLSRARAVTVVTATLGLAGAGLALGAPAQASTSYSCTVTPLKPVFTGAYANGVKILDYRIAATCSANRYLYIQQQRWEADPAPNPDDYLGFTDYSLFVYGGAGTVIHNYRTLVNGEKGAEEVYQKVRFRVSSGGAWSSFTGWQNSSILSITN